MPILVRSLLPRIGATFALLLAILVIAPRVQALTAASLAASNLPGKTLRFTITAGNAPFETSGAFTIVFGLNSTYTMPVADGNAAFRSGTYGVSTDAFGTVIKLDGYILNNNTVEVLIIPNASDAASQFEMYTLGANKRGTVVFDPGSGGGSGTGAPAITSALTATATVGTPFSYTITASPAATSFTNAGGDAPVAINPTTGVVTGTFTRAGTFRFSFTASNSVGSSPVTTVTVTATTGTAGGGGTSGGGDISRYVGRYVGKIGSRVGTTVNTSLTDYDAIVAANGTVTVNAGLIPAAFVGTIASNGVVTFTSGSGIQTYNIQSALVEGTTFMSSYGTAIGGAQYRFEFSTSFTPATGTSPTITTQPAAQSVAPGGSVTFSIAATGTGLSYQWLFNNVAITGATSASYTLGTVTVANAGNYAVRVTNANGVSVTSNAATLTVSATAPVPYLGNLSVRARAGAGDATLIVGVTIGGGSGAKNVLIRGVGPALNAFGVGDLLADPVLNVYQGSTMIRSNDDWAGDATIAATSVSVGAFALPAGSRDAALNGWGVTPGSYSVHLTGKAGATGNALIELYDLTPASSVTASNARFTNLSARTFGGTGNDTLIVGFTISGPSTRRLVFRAVGPGLAGFGVGGTMNDPKLELYQGETKIGENDNWEANTLATQRAVGAFDLASGSRDAVLVSALQPGGYTVQVTGGTTGVVLVEVYEAP
jgi:hypothetical protein